MTEEYLVYLYSNKPDLGLENLKRSLKKFGYEYKVIGLGDRYDGFVSLISKYVSELEKVDPQRWIIKLDAHDVFAVQSLKNFLVRIKQIRDGISDRHVRDPLIVSGERMRTFFPLPEIYYRYHGINIKRCSYPYINSGCIIGRADRLLDYYRWTLNSPFRYDDQVGLIKYADFHPQNVLLLTECELVFNYTGMDSINIENGIRGCKDTNEMSSLQDTSGTSSCKDTNEMSSCKDKSGTSSLRDKRTGSDPIFIHIPGRSYDLYSRMNRVGRFILGSAYLEVPFLTRLSEASDKIFGSINRYVKFFLFILILVLLWIHS